MSQKVFIFVILFESLKSQTSSCENHFEIGRCLTIEMVLQNLLAVSSPLVGVSYYKRYYGLLESKLFIILTKYISLERSESQDSIFGNLCFMQGRGSLTHSAVGLISEGCRGPTGFGGEASQVKSS